MAKWVEIDPDEVPNVREPHRGRVSYPLLKSFLETGMTVSMLDRTGIQQSLQSLNSCLGAYIRSHDLPIRIFNRKGEIYAARTDLDEAGKPNPRNNDINKVGQAPRAPAGKAPIDIDATDIPTLDDAEVQARHAEEKDQVLK